MSSRRLHVGVDAWNLLRDRRGIGRYTRALLREWSTTFVDDVDLTLLVPEWPAWWYAPRYRREAHANLGVRSRAAAEGTDIDVLWFPWNGLSWTARKPKVAVLHDASIFALDMAPAQRQREVLPFRRAVTEGARIVTDSEFSKCELLRYLSPASQAIDVVPLGVDPPSHDTPPRPKLPFSVPYIFFVGEFEKRKGIDLLLDAVARLDADLQASVGLVLAGETRGTTPFETRLPIAILGHVDDVALAALYSHAAVFVYPSRYEGFGLPVLEAMAHGTPVVASNAGGIPEAGGNAANYFTSGDAHALAASLTEVLRNSNLAEDLRQRGLLRAREMTWTRTAQKTLALVCEHTYHAGDRPSAGTDSSLAH